MVSLSVYTLVVYTVISGSEDERVDEVAGELMVVLQDGSTEPIPGLNGCTSITEKLMKDVEVKKFCS